MRALRVWTQRSSPRCLIEVPAADNGVRVRRAVRGAALLHPVLECAQPINRADRTATAMSHSRHHEQTYEFVRLPRPHRARDGIPGLDRLGAWNQWICPTMKHDELAAVCVEGR